MHNIILGLSAFYHDSAAALLKDGKIISAAQEERFTRKKHDADFPINAVRYCLSEAKIKLSDVTDIVFYDNPKLKFSRILATYISYAPRGFNTFSKATRIWFGGKLNWRAAIRKNLKNLLVTGDPLNAKLTHVDHHESHAASAFYPSPFEKAIILCLDGVGEWDSSSVWIGDGATLKKIKSMRFPHSLGLLYSAFTYYAGFKVNSGEYKLMGLAPYGEPKYVNTIKDNLIDIKADGSFRLNMDYFDFPIQPIMINSNFEKLFGGPPRKPEDKLTQRDMDIAKSIQVLTEEVVLALANQLYQEFKIDNLCLAGGVALNCVSNGVLLRESFFKNIWIQPAAGDAGGALGAALIGKYKNTQTRVIDQNLFDEMAGAYLGPKFDDDSIEDFLKSKNIKYSKFSTSHAMTKKVSQLIADGNIIGWFQGRMEFGPRALGARSILADPRNTEMQSQLNLKIKYRESFRPFAPSVMEEYVNEWFYINKSPYMLFVANVHETKCIKPTKQEIELQGFDRLKVKRSQIPAVTHLDYSARVQTVSKTTNPIFYKLIEDFYELTACPILINTSFNVRGEPIVCTPADAYRCFMHTEMDYLVLENYLLVKAEQPIIEKSEKWINSFALD
ncbi:MAG TPA: carbamoyltransferase [Gammaproteobacteria bacterium]|nr:carbamoyltransferase [Gammaproteobacteria bacterium]